MRGIIQVRQIRSQPCGLRQFVPLAGPSFKMQNCPYIASSGIKFGSYLPVGENAFKASYLPNLLIRKSEAPFISQFDHCISVIVSLCSKEKMIWIYAGGIVAFMEYVLINWDVSIMKLPAYSVCVPLISLIVFNKSISKIMVCLRPHPTLAKFRPMAWYRSVFIHSVPKSFKKWFVSVFCPTGRRATLSPKAINRITLKRITAVLAFLCNFGNFDSHKSSSLICATLRVVQHAGAFPFIATNPKGVN